MPQVQPLTSPKIDKLLASVEKLVKDHIQNKGLDRNGFVFAPVKVLQDGSIEIFPIDIKLFHETLSQPVCGRCALNKLINALMSQANILSHIEDACPPEQRNGF